MELSTRKKRTFETTKYWFSEVVKEMFKVEDLETINEHYKSDYGLVSAPVLGKPSKGNLKGTDQGTVFHERFYKEAVDGTWSTAIHNILKAFIMDEIAPLADSAILYQKIPTFRVQLPNNLSVGGWHRDRDYNHSPHEINVYLPLTEAKNTNTIWAESEEGKEDYESMDAEYGEYYLWSGANLNHGNKKNEEGKCRVSLDFRILPFDKYDESEVKESYGVGTRFKLGEYWESLV